MFEFADQICPRCAKIWPVDADRCDVCGTSLRGSRRRSGVLKSAVPTVTMRRDRPEAAVSSAPDVKAPIPGAKAPIPGARAPTPEAKAPAPAAKAATGKAGKAGTPKGKGPKGRKAPADPAKAPTRIRKAPEGTATALPPLELAPPDQGSDPPTVGIERVTISEDEVAARIVRFAPGGASADDPAPIRLAGDDDGAPTVAPAEPRPVPAKPAPAPVAPREIAAEVRAEIPRPVAEERGVVPSEPVPALAPPPTDRDVPAWVTSAEPDPSSGKSVSLAAIVDEMNREMRALRSQVEQGSKIQRTLEEARRSQTRMLSPLPELPGYAFATRFRPCAYIGGDFYDFVDVMPGHLGIALGDISGHGLEAALVVGLLKKALDIHARGEESPAEVLRRVNQDIVRDLNRSTFVSLFYGVLEIATRRLRVVRAGHHPLLLFNPDRDPQVSMVQSRGMVLGMEAGSAFDRFLEEVTVELRPGDLVLQYTDGVLETTNVFREEFGLSRLQRAVTRLGRQDLDACLDGIEGLLEQFRGDGPQEDDVTLLAMRVR